jgi:hypothetical protein
MPEYMMVVVGWVALDVVGAVIQFKTTTSTGSRKKKDGV